MFKSINPATGEDIANYPELSREEIAQKLDLAMTAFQQWRRTPPAARAELLSRIADTFERNKDRLAAMATREMGKTLKSSLAEVEKCISGFRYYAKAGPEMLAPTRTAQGSVETYWLPQGAVLAIMPWNFPYWQVVRFLAPTIMAGNVGLLKHASLVQGVANLLEEMVHEAGAPAGLFQNLAIKSDAVATLIADPRIVAVTLTGSEGAGAAVAEQAGRNLKKIVLELGGSDPFIVMPSADLDQAVAQAVTARIQNTGQSCICGKRMIVHTAIYDTFLERFAAAMRAVKAGDPMDPHSDMGPLSSMGQRDTVLRQLAEARKIGATLLCGGEKPEGPGAYLTAGILTDIPVGSAFTAEEIFGPIAMMFRAADLADALRIANDVPFGLGSSVWTQNAEEQARFITDLQTGMTAFNQILASMPEAPFGGVKRSGHGRELGEYGLQEFMNVKSVFYAR
ncbi:MAG TPA: NAD-dependent succinate-semialdehyde dehydrogenase [Acidocella sp.]|jgi:succinate-semialdehyde dehydrogenase/glutarate-semialdehyde dehydrogenase|nr:NAD-dependent succinate-semialdehyde dehydrogenase [Acidocella sp.]